MIIIIYFLIGGLIMVNSYKACMYYREMQGHLMKLDLVENLVYFKNHYKSDSELFKKGLQTNFGNNLYTFQAVILFREVIINSGINKTESVKNKENLSRIINLYIKITKYLFDNKKTKLEEILFGLKHSQLWYQKMSNKLYIHLNFYLNYYGNSDILSEIILERLGINISDAIKLAYLIANHSETHFYQDLDNKNGLYNKEIKYFLKNFSIEITELRKELIDSSNKSDKFFNYNSMLYNGLTSIFDKPLIKIGTNYTCIFPMLTLNRVTTAISYLFSRKDSYNGVKMSTIFGDNNQNFIYNLLITNLEGKLNIINTDSYQKNYKGKGNTPKNPDIILESEDSIFFIECKSTSIKYDSKSKSKLLEFDKDRLKDYMQSMHKKIHYYNNLETGENYFGLIKSNKKVIALITFLENPYIDGYYSNLINNEIIKENIILENTVNNNRIFISDNLAIIYIIDLIKKIGLDKLLLELNSTQYNGNDTDSIIDNIYSKNNLSYDNIKFENDLIDILENELKEI